MGARQGMDIAIYGVGLPEQFAFDTGMFDRMNLGIFRAFLSALEKTPVRRLVYVSTYEVFRAGRARSARPMPPPGWPACHPTSRP